MSPSSAQPRQLSPGRAVVFPLALAASLPVLGVLYFGLRETRLVGAFLGATMVLVAWALGLWVTARRRGRPLGLEIGLYAHHWVQACAQIAVFVWWGWSVRFVYAFMPLILAQVIFAYGVDGLLSWSRRGTWKLGFGPFPIILSINLFLWFEPDWFHWQFVMILVGYLAKEFIRWERDGRSRHIFNPSSFPLGVFSLTLLLTGTTDITLGLEIAQSQFVPPYIYLCIFLVSLPGQILFGVARMTLAAVATMFAISWAYFTVTGTYLFYDAFISLPVFLGMHLLFTDPSTSPRTELGQIAFGVLYSLLTVGFYVVLSAVGAPTFYDKLLPVPIMNLMVRRIDRIARSDIVSWLDPARIGRTLAPRARHAAYTSAWGGLFVALSAAGGFGDDHPGQFLPFWEGACRAGSDRACEYAVFMTSNYCDRGSGWACNEWAVYLTGIGRVRDGRQVFRRGCDLGFPPACRNAEGPAAGPATSAGIGGGVPAADGGGESAVDVAGSGEVPGGYVRAAPRVEDLPILLQGSKGPVRERDPARLRAMACEQGWAGACTPASRGAAAGSGS